MKRSKHQREPTEEEKSVVVSVRHCAGELNDILQGARRKVQSNAKLFAESGISVMFRGIDSYADMYEKLKLKSRETLERLFTKFADCEDVQDAEDAIEETEGNWRNFLANLDQEVNVCDTPSQSPNKHSTIDPETDQQPNQLYFKPAAYPLIDTHTNREVSLGEYLVEKTCVLVTFQPAYWPDTCIRWRHAEVAKVKAFKSPNLHQLYQGFNSFLSACGVHFAGSIFNVVNANNVQGGHSYFTN
ncbi:unnamed protein product [Echinostoma caproni]|uniref:PWWP domain-containing protein n=1 Tax=Echinostoma caproni TaxID=27848 RepID=A0A183BDC3_9TREM|nr:unnamed protein product [Echinostoma caproni]